MLSMEYTCAIDYNRTKTSLNLPLMVPREVISFFTVCFNQFCDVVHRRVAVREALPDVFPFSRIRVQEVTCTLT